MTEKIGDILITIRLWTTLDLARDVGGFRQKKDMMLAWVILMAQNLLVVDTELRNRTLNIKKVMNVGYYYKFYDPEHNFKLIGEGKYTSMPFYWNEDKCPIVVPMVFGQMETFCGQYADPYNCTGLLSRSTAIKLQQHMYTNKTMFTDMMDENHTDTLVFRIE